MRRVQAAIAIFIGWASLPVGAMAGLVASQFLGLNQGEGPVPTTTVYGISAAVLVWVFVAAALVTAIPLAMAMFAVSAHRNLYATAVGMAAVGVFLAPDQLGRAFGFPVLVGAVAMAVGGRLLQLEKAAEGVGGTRQRFGPLQTWVFDVAEPAGDDPSDPNAAPGAAIESTAWTTPVLEPMTTASIASAGVPPEPPPSAGTRTGRRKQIRKAAAGTICQWCSASVAVEATTCPTCKASLNAPAADSMAISGLTQVQPELRAYAQASRGGKRRSSLLKMIFSDTAVSSETDAPPPSDAAALRPPSRELRGEMARLDADIAAGQVDPGRQPASNEAARPPEATPEATPGSAEPRRRNPRT